MEQEIIVDIARLFSKPSKEELFFAYMIKFMGPDDIAHMTTSLKEQVSKRISTRADSLHAANHYIARLVKRGLVKSLGGGAYQIVPRILVDATGMETGHNDSLTVHYASQAEREVLRLWM